MHGDGQAASGMSPQKTNISKTFAILLGANLRFAPFVNAVQGRGCVLHAFWIMLLMV
jgi:uncharacterized protein YjbI with pentapeptide repeats